MKILIIHILRFGDALQLTPIIKSMKETYQDASISVVTSSLGAQVFSKQNEVDQVFQVSIDELVPLIKSSRIEDVHSAIDILENEFQSILSQKWDWVINFNYTFASALLTYLFKGTHCSGFYATSERLYFAKENWFAYSIAAFTNRKYSTFNWVDINKNLINLASVPQRTMFPVNAETIGHIDFHLDKIGFKGQKIIGLAPGTSGSYKQWPVENFTALAGSLISDHGYKVIVLGDENDRDLGHQIKTEVGAGCEDLTGKTTLSELGGYLSKCDILVSNDSGSMHLANAMGTPAISLFFSTHFVETGPYGPDNIVVYPDIPCFPCKSTARCDHKECLTYIRPETVEKIVCDHEGLLRGDYRITLTNEDDPISANRSVFDPWGNLDWIPLNNRQFKRDDMIRLMFKTVWISTLNYDGATEADLQAYTEASLKNYEPFDQHDGTEIFFHQLIEDFTEMADLYRQSHILSMQIYNALISGEQETVVKLGEQLQQKEDEIAGLGENEYLSPLIEYINIRLDNMSEADMVHLSLKTSRVYQKAENLARKLKLNSEQLSNHLLPN